MKEKLDSIIKELDGVDLVLDKLEGKSNVSVFEKLCANCDRIFNTFCEMSIVEIVRSGYARMALDFLNRLKGQVIRLANYKEALTAYIEMENASLSNGPSVEAVEAKAESIANEVNNVKNLSLNYQEGKAA